MRLQFVLAFVTIVCLPCSWAWWQNAVFYQIYPRSFMDSNGDGIGDLQGIVSRLHHLKSAGVTAVWLSPIYKSPQVDAGYDISDYMAIQEEYGTMEDFEQLIAAAKQLGLKVIMDLVPNHSSNEHEWFVKSENRTRGYEDYYVWRDGRYGDDRTPPNNWISVFKYSAWTYSSIRRQWYLHQFAAAQPDLNFRNPRVIDEIKNVMKFWMDKGVYGFRVDAVPHIGEADTFEDEPRSFYPNVKDFEYDYLLHTLTKDQQLSFDVIYTLREFIDEYNGRHQNEDERIMMTEASSDIKDIMRWYGDGKRLGAQFTFNFQLLGCNKGTTAKNLFELVHSWIDRLPTGCVSNWLVGNHDNHRVASRVGTQNVDGYNMLVHMLPGVAVTYQGEEIGMEDGEVTYEQGQDPSACNGPPEAFNWTSRDFERTPYHWDTSKNAGFSTANTTWLPVSRKYLENNLRAQTLAPISTFKVYQNLTSLRSKSRVLRDGDLEIKYTGNTLVLRRFHSTGNENNHILFFNLGDASTTFDLSSLFPRANIDRLRIVIINQIERQNEIIKRFVRVDAHQAFIAVQV